MSKYIDDYRVFKDVYNPNPNLFLDYVWQHSTYYGGVTHLYYPNPNLFVNYTWQHRTYYEGFKDADHPNYINIK
jgi:hypothetical protein